MTALKSRVLGGLGAAALALAMPGGAAAHPHVWIDARSEVVFDAQHRVAALKVSWRFDEFYSQFAIEGLDKDGDGVVSDAELRPLAELNVTSLKEYRYFTYIVADGQDLPYGPVTDYASHFVDGILSLEFVVPLETPVDPLSAELSFKSYDPTFYIAVEPALEDPVRFTGAPPPQCRPVEREGQDGETLDLSEADFNNPVIADSIGALYATTFTIVCDTAGAIQ